MNGFKLRGFWIKFVKNESMGARSLDNEFNKYWALLTPVQKESLLSVIKSFVHSDQDTIEQYNKEIDDAVSRVEEGQYYTQEEVEKMSKIGSE